MYFFNGCLGRNTLKSCIYLITGRAWAEMAMECMYIYTCIFPKQCLHYGVLNCLLRLVKGGARIPVAAETPAGTPGLETSENRRNPGFCAKSLQNPWETKVFTQKAGETKGKPRLLHKKLANPLGKQRFLCRNVFVQGACETEQKTKVLVQTPGKTRELSSLRKLRETRVFCRKN